MIYKTIVIPKKRLRRLIHRSTNAKMGTDSTERP